MRSLTLANLSLFDAKQSSSAYEYLISANAHELFSMTKARKAIITSRHVTSRRTNDCNIKFDVENIYVQAQAKSGDDVPK